MTPREWRESKNLTQADMSKKIGISKGYLSLLESGKRKPSFDVIKAYELLTKKKITSKNFEYAEAQP